MGNVETATKFSRLKNISSIEDKYPLFVFKCLFYNYKEKL